MCSVLKVLDALAALWVAKYIAGYFATYSRKSHSDSALCSNISRHVAVGSLATLPVVTLHHLM